MSQGPDERRGGVRAFGAVGAALGHVRARRVAGVVMAVGIVVSLVVLAATLALTTRGVAVAIFLVFVLLSCAVSCFVAWRLSEHAARDLADQVEGLAHRRAGEVKPS